MTDNAHRLSDDVYRCSLDGVLEICREQWTDCDCRDDGLCWRIETLRCCAERLEPAQSERERRKTCVDLRISISD